MHLVKGFVTISQYINNTPGSLSLIGELSTQSTTYSKEKGEYQDSNLPGYKLITFKSIDTVTGTELIVSSEQVNQILQIVKACIDYGSIHIRPYDVIDFKNTLLADFFLRVSNINLGGFADNGSIALPEWISWTSDEFNGALIKIWLSDQAFSEQYDDYSIVVIPPVANLDDFYGFYNTAVATAAERTFPQLSDLIQTYKDENPETYMKLMNFDYVNRLNLDQKTSTNWATLIYGAAGDNIDSIKDAIVEYILANSSHTRSEWTIIFPEIFKRTEFIILPRWDKLSIPNLTVMSSLYSSLADPRESLDFAKANVLFYPGSFIEGNCIIMPHDYKALSLVVINGKDNLPGKQKLTELFGDYIPASTYNPDFNRMQLKTREWLILLEQLLITAETMTEYTSVPRNLHRIKREGILFISLLHDNINYLMAAKSNAFYSI